MLSALMYSTVI
jgi:hypothetical protein